MAVRLFLPIVSPVSERRGCPRSDATAIPGGDRFAVDPETGHCYVSFDSELTDYPAASSACLSLDGHLVTVGSAPENAFAVQVINPAENPWIGAEDDDNDTDAIFNWVTGEPFVFANFAPGEPDDDAAFGGNGECLHIANPVGQWADTNCLVDSYVTGRLCELEP